jgi:anti-sigma regulatory factor (Ser/Thr protein kinase)
VTARRTFYAEIGSIPAARRFVADAVGEAPPDVLDALSVMVSELAMNAVQYAGTDFAVTAGRAGDIVRVEVTDAGAGLPELQPFPPASSPRGRGLLIVHLLSDEWGVVPAAGGRGKSVWFSLSTRPGPDSPIRLMPRPAGVAGPAPPADPGRAR